MTTTETTQLLTETMEDTEEAAVACIQNPCILADLQHNRDPEEAEDSTMQAMLVEVV